VDHLTLTSDIRQATRLSLHRIAVHVVARARSQATGRFSLRISPGGFGTPEFGDVQRRVRVSGATLIVEQDAPGAPSSLGLPLAGASLAAAAAAADVDLAAPLDVGHDTPPLGDVDAPLTVDETAAFFLADWIRLSAIALDRLLPALGDAAAPTPARLWPEHLDVAIDAATSPGLRANFGGSAGDRFSSEPYLYVGPWTEARPGGDGYWNAPFGAVAIASAVPDVEAATEFFAEGLDRLRG
jgi:hypothetical protein